jgi:sugar/nucleoside kinase (ribokinase family)
MVSVAKELAFSNVAKIVVVTGGRHGVVLVESGGKLFHQVANKVKVSQVQGAGAVFSAAFTSALLHDERLRRAALFACTAATMWCTLQPGERPPSMERVWAAIE